LHVGGSEEKEEEEEEGNLVSGGRLLTHLWRACDPPVAGLSSGGLVTGGLVTGGLVAGGLVTGRLVTGRLVSVIPTMRPSSTYQFNIDLLC